MNRSQCKFDLAWIGTCQKKPENSSDYCKEHNNLECDSCGQQAIKSCYETMGQGVCCKPICGNCEHEISEDGTNGFTTKHCEKNKQKYKPWYARK